MAAIICDHAESDVKGSISSSQSWRNNTVKTRPVMHGRLAAASLHPNSTPPRPPLTELMVSGADDDNIFPVRHLQEKKNISWLWLQPFLFLMSLQSWVDTYLANNYWFYGLSFRMLPNEFTINSSIPKTLTFSFSFLFVCLLFNTCTVIPNWPHSHNPFFSFFLLFS